MADRNVDPGFGQANIQSARVTLPLSLALDPNNSLHVCDYDVALAVHGGAVGCPASTIVWWAAAVTPLLSQPLTGNVYLVKGIRFNKQGQRIRTLPSLLVPLRGQIALDLRAQTSVDGASRLVTTFATIPDAPVSSFTLQITGGPSGLLVITGRGENICTGDADRAREAGRAVEHPGAAGAANVEAMRTRREGAQAADGAKPSGPCRMTRTATIGEPPVRLHSPLQRPE